MHNIVTSSSDLYAVFIGSWQAEWHLWLLIDGWYHHHDRKTLTEMTGVCWSAPSQSGRAPAPGPSPRWRLSSTGRGSPSPGSLRSGRAWHWKWMSVLFTWILFFSFYVCHTIKHQVQRRLLKTNKCYFYFSCSHKSLSAHRAQHDPGPEAALNWHRGRPGPGTDAGAGQPQPPDSGHWTLDSGLRGDTRANWRVS